MLKNGTFTEGWRDLTAAPGNLINQEPNGWRLEWIEPGQPLYDDASSRAAGVPECIHKLSEQLPPNEQLGRPNALILAGDTTYKIFHANAPFGATLSQTVSDLLPGSEATLTVPIQVHLRGESDFFGAESGIWVNGEGGWVNGHTMGDRKWFRHRLQFTVPHDGRAEIVIRVKSKWPRGKDFFIDGITLQAVPANTEPDPESTGAFRFTHWPTEYRQITQAYNNNPTFYRQWGLTGHEGVDIHAPYESRIFSVAPGAVYLIRTVDDNHAYGNAVYLKHADGYRTAYAHLKQLHVRVGDEVQGGQLLGLANGTGNVVPKPTSQAPGLGSHLHLTLYHDGATERGETEQPKDIIDPTPFLSPLLADEWQAPDAPLVNGWGWADSIERRNNLGRVSYGEGINVRERPEQIAPIKGLAPEGTIVSVTGPARDNYFPLQVAAAALGAPPDSDSADRGKRFARKVLNFANSAGDYSSIQAGRQFQVTWTLQNTGTESWTTNARLVYVEAQRPETAGHTLSSLSAAVTHHLPDLTGHNRVQPNETAALTLTLIAPMQPGRYAAHWQLQTEDGQPIGPPLWMRIGVAAVPAPPPERRPDARFRAGMNVNPDAHDLDVDRLRGLDWVRFVYKASAKHRNIDEAFRQQYSNIIQTYAGAGIKSLLVINQETEWGNAPWDNGDWLTYAGALARAARRIAELCTPFGDTVAYQIWNEQDSPPSNPSAIGVAAEDFAPLLAQTAASIRQVNPDATVIIGGLNSGPDNAVNYVKRIEARLGAPVPVNALAIHPYGRYVHSDPFYEERFGTLQDALRIFRQAFPHLPLWITELGVADNNPIGPEHYEKIAVYMREIVTEVAESHTNHVHALIWFAWSDLMRNAGITIVDGRLKPHIGDAFREMVALSRQPRTFTAETALAEAAAFTARSARANSEFLRFTTTLQDHNAVPAGASFTNRWHFRNSGSTTWEDDYRLVYAPEGDDVHPLMSRPDVALGDVASPLPAAPGTEVVISLTMTAPEQPGRFFRSRWELRDPQDQVFGHLYAEITTVRPSTVGSGAQHADMAFIADHTVPDDTTFTAGETFLKQWRVRNTGARKWGDGFRLVFLEGDLQMALGAASHLVPPTGRGEEAILSVPMVAPPARADRPTTYQSLWRLQDDRGNYVGTPIWARIVSLATGAGTPLGRFANPAGWYSQLDPRWSGLRLGHGQQDIGGWGCLLTCHAMMLTAFGLRLNPAELNQRLLLLGDSAFRGSNVQFAAPTHVLQGVQQMRHLRSWPTPEIPFTEWTGEDPIARIDRALTEGYVMLAQVDREPNNAFYHSNTEQHWVILLARTPARDDYLILDPIVPVDQTHTQPSSLMRKYGTVAPSRPHEENLRNAIKSALAYGYMGGTS